MKISLSWLLVLFSNHSGPVNQQLSQHSQLLQLPSYCFSSRGFGYGKGVSKESVLGRGGVLD